MIFTRIYYQKLCKTSVSSLNRLPVSGLRQLLICIKKIDD